MTNNIFINLLKQYTNIDIDFINKFFKKFKIDGELNFDIEDKNVAKYLNTQLSTLRKRLNNTFTKAINFVENVDYIKIKNKKLGTVKYMLNYQCFERLAMGGDTQEAETVRMYFVKLREFLVNNQHAIFQAMENKTLLNKTRGFESIYFFAVDERKKDWHKVGETRDIIIRLQNYNVGRTPEVDLKYYALVKNSELIEKCIKVKLKDKSVFANKEIFKVDEKSLKKIIDDCYCQNVTKKENAELYEEISQFMGFYTYVKDKVNIKPYVIIRKKLELK